MASATFGDFESTPDLSKAFLVGCLGHFARSGSAFRVADPMIKVHGMIKAHRMNMKTFIFIQRSLSNSS
jgi:hypothetical protein